MTESRKKLVIAATAAAVALVVIVALVAFVRGSDERALNKQLRLGEQYLSELDYESALVAYQAAIQIDPRNVEAYRGAALAYVGMGDYESAERILREGYDATGDQTLLDFWDELSKGRSSETEISDDTEEDEEENSYVLPFELTDYRMGDLTIEMRPQELLSATNYQYSRTVINDWEEGIGSYLGYPLSISYTPTNYNSLTVSIDDGAYGIVDSSDLQTGFHDSTEERNLLLTGPLLAGDSISKVFELIPLQDIFEAEEPGEDSNMQPYTYEAERGRVEIYWTYMYWPGDDGAEVPSYHITIRCYDKKIGMSYAEMEISMDITNQYIEEIRVWGEHHD